VGAAACWPHEDPTLRVLHRPSTAAGLHLAASAACGARVFRSDGTYARRLLGAAETAYAAARREPALLAPGDDGAFGGGPYDDADLGDDFAWAAAELRLATGEAAYTEDARRCATPDALPLKGFDWHRIAPAGALDLAWHGDSAAAATVMAAADRLVELQAAQPWGQPYAPADGWDWGSNRISYLQSHLRALADAVDDGADVHRYFVWSLLDSFEWELGYTAPFGLLHVDFTTGRRTFKRSAHWYRELIGHASGARRP
jgi:endoglucanase